MRLAFAACLFALCACNDTGRSDAAARASANAQDTAGVAPPATVALADSLLPRLVRLSGLSSTGALRIRSRTPDQVRAYVQSRLTQDMPGDELNAMRDTYALLGLVPDTLDMRALLLELYMEQVVGYYDAATKTMYVLAGADPAALRPVLAHELVHALQDEHVDVDSLIAPGRGNDRQAAAHAALEGHATIVMFALLAEDAEGHALDPVQLPNPSDQLRAGLETQNSQFPVFGRAPAILRETLLFPYIGGADYVHTLWSADSGHVHRAPIGDLLPQSTEQILHTKSKFIAQRDTPTDLRFAAFNDAKWRVRREETFGELELAILLDHYLGTAARRSAEGWDGDRYQLLENAQKQRALISYSIWDDAASADRFAAAVKRVAAKRTGRSTTIDRTDIGGRPGVRVMDTPTGVAAPAVAVPVITQSR
jgi:hypothetical protein